MGDSQYISLLLYGIDDDTVMSSGDRVNAYLRNYMDNFIDVDDNGLYLEENELFINIISIIISSSNYNNVPID